MEPALAQQLNRQIENCDCRHKDVVLTVDFKQLTQQTDLIRQTLDQHKLDFILFSRNDQIFDNRNIGPLIRELRVGYSTFSAIDSNDVWPQTEQCLTDYFERRIPLDLPSRVESGSSKVGNRTFSLIFDLEQLAGARFGLPRVLELLHEFDVRANFFLTSVIQEVYPGTIEQLVASGHEIGLHGRYHEYLSGIDIQKQSEMIRSMKADLSSAAPIRGANFIYRMDNTTVRSMIANQIDYFVTFMEHRYAPFAFGKPPLQPMLVNSENGQIWLMPVSVETYNRPWFAVKNMIDSSASVGPAESSNHINILCHPFRDGAQRHISKLRKLLTYLTKSLQYQSSGLNQVAATLPKYQPDCYVYYSLESNDTSSHAESTWQRWWSNRRRYDWRIGNLVQSLTAGGKRPALCFQPPSDRQCFAVYPYLPPSTETFESREVDPLCHSFDPVAFAKSWKNSYAKSQNVSFMPRSYRHDLGSAIQTMRPRRAQDVTASIPEFALRLGYRLTANRNVF